MIRLASSIDITSFLNICSSLCSYCAGLCYPGIVMWQRRCVKGIGDEKRKKERDVEKTRAKSLRIRNQES